MKYKTMQQIANDIGVSKQTIFRCIKDNNIKETGKKGNAFMYDAESVETIKEILGFKEPEPNIKELKENRQEVDSKDHTEALEDLYKDFANEREVLRAEYKEQLQAKDKQIADLTKLLDQQQQLSLIDNKKVEALQLELKKKTEQEEAKPRASIFNIFKRQV